MQGLLDFIKTPEGQGLLSGVFGYAANARKGAPINSLGRGGLAGLMGYSNAIDREQQAQEANTIKDFRTMQMDRMRQQMEAEQAAEAERQRLKWVVSNALMGVSPTQAISADSSGPTVKKSEMIGQRPQLDPRQLIAQGVPLETVKQLMEVPNFGRSKVARTVKGMGPDGREYEYQVDEYGQRVGDGLAQYRAPIQTDLGGEVKFLDPYKLQPVTSLSKTMTPDGRDASARGWAGVQNARDRLAFDQGQAQLPEYKDGAWVYKPTFKNPQGVVVPAKGIDNAKPLTESQGKANLFGTRALESNAVLEEVAKDGTDRPGWIKRTGEATVGVIPDWAGGEKLSSAAGAALNWTQSANQQRVEQAQRDFVNAILRRESGAVISPQEFANAQKQYFPMIGDTPEVIAQKQRNREIAIRGIEAEVPGGFRNGSKKPDADGNKNPPWLTPSSGSKPLTGFRIVEVK